MGMSGEGQTTAWPAIILGRDPIVKRPANAA
jgi:hypothetical protein